MGLFAVLDEECLFPKGTDQTFFEKMQRSFGNNAVFKIQGKNFLVKHYAGDVNQKKKKNNYKTKQFIFLTSSFFESILFSFKGDL